MRSVGSRPWVDRLPIRGGGARTSSSPCTTSCPRGYPLDGLTIQEILDSENSLGRLVDYGVILPHARAVYEHAASVLNTPQLLDMLRDGSPVYAWPYDERHVWTTKRAPLAMRTVRKLTSDLAFAPPASG